MDSSRILILGSNAATAQDLSVRLAGSGHIGIFSSDMRKASASLAGQPPDAVLVCLSENGDGMDLLDQVCGTSPALPTLIATPARAIQLRVDALNRGAADYLIEPFAVDELLDRIDTLRHRRQSRSPGDLTRDDLTFNRKTGRLARGEASLWLTPSERSIFAELFSREALPVAKRELKETLGLSGPGSDNAVEVLIYRLRAKLQGIGLRIRTRRGLGYELEAGPAA